MVARRQFPVYLYDHTWGHGIRRIGEFPNFEAAQEFAQRHGYGRGTIEYRRITHREYMPENNPENWA